MRAVTGSSAEDCFCRTRCGVASMLCAALSALIRSASSETLGPASLPGSWAVPESPALSWSRKAGQFGQVGVVGEGLAEAGLVVAELDFGDGEVLPDAVAFGAVAVGQAFQGVQDGTRPLMLPRERGLAGDRAFEIHVGRELRMKDQAETQAAIDAERNAGRLADVLRQGIELAAQDGGHVLA